MRNTTPCLLALLFATVTLCHGTAAAAQEARWFRVELLVFANNAPLPPAGGELPEQWDATPELVYPPAVRFLVDPARVRENMTEFDGESILDDYGRQIITIATTAADLPEAAGATAIEAPDAAAGTRQPAVEAEDANPAAPTPLTPVYEGETGAPAPLALPRPYVLLPQSYPEFRGKAALMQRSGRYSVLFHETWVQPVTGEDTSLPIVLDHSGDSHDWPRLQGTVTLYLSRYLHLTTNLWLNTAGEYLPGTWQMPAPPFGPPSLIIEEEEPIDFAGTLQAMPSDTGAVPGATPADTGIPPDVESGLDSAPSAGAEPGVSPEVDAAVSEAAETEAEAGPVYPYRHAVLLSQTRRMRSAEVHYIDHPLFGLIVKFTPVSAEELDAIATVEAEALPPDQSP